MGSSTETSSSFKLYKYDPSVPAACIFAVCYVVTTAFHIFQASKMRTLYFIPLILGGVCEIVGYISRAVAHYNESSIPVFIVQTIALLVAPTLFSASIYMVLGRIIIFTEGEKKSPVPARWLTKIFVVGDLISFLVQCGGGGMMANDAHIDQGKNLILLGLYLQLVFFGLFLVTGGIFHVRMARSPTLVSLQNNWAKYMYTLYAAGALVLVRSVFRVIEFKEDNSGPITTHEFYLYIFDAVLMLGVLVLFNLIHPGQIIGRRITSNGIRLDDMESLSDGSAFNPKH